MTDKDTTQGIEAQLATVVRWLESYRKEAGMTVAQFVARYKAHVGSRKQWEDRLLAEKFGELGARRAHWMNKLSALQRSLASSETMQDEIIDAMPMTRYAINAFEMLTAQKNDRRVAALIAVTGCGKSWAMRRLAMNNPRAVYIQAVPGWNDSLARISAGIARAIGTNSSNNGGKTFQGVLDFLQNKGVTLLIDDAQEMGVCGLKIVKAIVDQTPSAVVLGIYPTAWKNLIRGSSLAYSEAQQLMGRCLKPVRSEWIEGARAEDVRAYLHAKCGLNVPEEAADKIAQQIRTAGNLRTLCDAVEIAQINIDERDDDSRLTLQEIAEALRELCKRMI